MSNIFTIAALVIMGVLGGFSSLYVLISLPALVIWKIYRKIRYGYKITELITGEAIEINCKKHKK